MGRAMHAAHPVFREALDRCIAELGVHLDYDLRDVMWDSSKEDELRRTVNAQTSIFAVSYATALLWKSRGAQPVAMIGHSVGELVAACLAGVLSLTEALGLVALRGRLMGALPAGSMLTVRCAPDALLCPEGVDLAAVNAPKSSVVSGPVERIADYARTLAERGIMAKLLPTSHAFHSAMMDSVLSPFGEAVARVHFAPPAVPIVSTVTGELLRDDEATDPAYWTLHLRRTVRFADAMASAARLYPERYFVEVGPRSALTQLTRTQPAEKGRGSVAASLAESSDEVSAFEEALRATEIQ